jgi:hypothetical protein
LKADVEYWKKEANYFKDKDASKSIELIGLKNLVRKV